MISGSDSESAAKREGEKIDANPDETAERERTRRTTILRCPQCGSHRAIFLDTKPPRAKCANCSSTYKIKTVDPHPTESPEPEPEPDQKPRKCGGHKQQRQDPIPAPPISLKDLGTLTAYIETVLDGGPKAVRAATKEAERLSKRYGARVDPQWLLLTPWLDTVYRHQPAVGQGHRQRFLKANGRYTTLRGKDSAERIARDRVRYALVWRATFIATYAVSASKTASCTAAKVSTATVDKHYAEDKDFAVQVDAARAHAIDLLHTRVMQRALEGDLEPVYFQGVKVDHVRRFSDRIQIEMLRAHLPKTFKTPGLHGAVTVNTGDQVLVLDEETRMKIIEARRRARGLPAKGETPVIDVTPSTPKE